MTIQRRALGLSFLLAVACHGGSAGSAPAMAGTQQELVDAMAGSAAAWNRGDVQGHVALYTDSATMMFKAGPQLAFRDLAVNRSGGTTP